MIKDEGKATKQKVTKTKKKVAKVIGQRYVPNENNTTACTYPEVLMDVLDSGELVKAERRTIEQTELDKKNLKDMTRTEYESYVMDVVSNSNKPSKYNPRGYLNGIIRRRG